MSNKKAKCTLELRHQRTCDVCFDWAITKDNLSLLNREDSVDKKKIKIKSEAEQQSIINNDGISRSDYFKPNNYIYRMIETMLPKARAEETKKHIRLAEL